jgi:hypothetical protein
MHKPRELKRNVWYQVRTALNNPEPVFRLGFAVVLFCRVLIEAKGRFPFEMRGLVLSGGMALVLHQARRRVPVA